ncbi:hypothetical protein ACFXPQ_32425 [Streptomyces lydicus]|uniref:hypothetical protein n=1 Tax=Streptomyces lydicus TaxID=47763 RepID=UPI00369404B4
MQILRVFRADRAGPAPHCFWRRFPYRRRELAFLDALFVLACTAVLWLTGPGLPTSPSRGEHY